MFHVVIPKSVLQLWSNGTDMHGCVLLDNNLWTRWPLSYKLMILGHDVIGDRDIKHNKTLPKTS